MFGNRLLLRAALRWRAYIQPLRRRGVKTSSSIFVLALKQTLAIGAAGLSSPRLPLRMRLLCPRLAWVSQVILFYSAGLPLPFRERCVSPSAFASVWRLSL